MQRVINHIRSGIRLPVTRFNNFSTQPNPFKPNKYASVMIDLKILNHTCNDTIVKFQKLQDAKENPDQSNNNDPLKLCRYDLVMTNLKILHHTCNNTIAKFQELRDSEENPDTKNPDQTKNPDPKFQIKRLFDWSVIVIPTTLLLGVMIYKFHDTVFNQYRESISTDFECLKHLEKGDLDRVCAYLNTQSLSSMKYDDVIKIISIVAQKHDYARNPVFSKIIMRNDFKIKTFLKTIIDTYDQALVKGVMDHYNRNIIRYIINVYISNKYYSAIKEICCHAIIHPSSSVDSPFSFQDSYSHYAYHDAFAEIINLLPDDNSDIEKRILLNELLRESIIRGYTLRVEYLYQRQADISHQDSKPMHLAIEYRGAKIVEFLLKKGATTPKNAYELVPNDSPGITALLFTHNVPFQLGYINTIIEHLMRTEQQHLILDKKLLEHNTWQKNLDHLLKIAAENDAKQVLNIFLKPYESMPDTMYIPKLNELTVIAARYNHVDLVNSLIKKGARFQIKARHAKCIELEIID